MDLDDDISNTFWVGLDSAAISSAWAKSSSPDNNNLGRRGGMDRV